MSSAPTFIVIGASINRMRRRRQAQTRTKEMQTRVVRIATKNLVVMIVCRRFPAKEVILVWWQRFAVDVPYQTSRPQQRQERWRSG